MGTIPRALSLAAITVLLGLASTEKITKPHNPSSDQPSPSPVKASNPKLQSRQRPTYSQYIPQFSEQAFFGHAQQPQYPGQQSGQGQYVHQYPGLQPSYGHWPVPDSFKASDPKLQSRAQPTFSQYIPQFSEQAFFGHAQQPQYPGQQPGQGQNQYAPQYPGLQPSYGHWPVPDSFRASDPKLQSRAQPTFSQYIPQFSEQQFFGHAQQPHTPQPGQGQNAPQYPGLQPSYGHWPIPNAPLDSWQNNPGQDQQWGYPQQSNDGMSSPWGQGNRQAGQRQILQAKAPQYQHQGDQFYQPLLLSRKQPQSPGQERVGTFLPPLVLPPLLAPQSGGLNFGKLLAVGPLGLYSAGLGGINGLSSPLLLTPNPKDQMRKEPQRQFPRSTDAQIKYDPGYNGNMHNQGSPYVRIPDPQDKKVQTKSQDQSQGSPNTKSHLHGMTHDKIVGAHDPSGSSMPSNSHQHGSQHESAQSHTGYPQQQSNQNPEKPPKFGIPAIMPPSTLKHHESNPPQPHPAEQGHNAELEHHQDKFRPEATKTVNNVPSGRFDGNQKTNSNEQSSGKPDQIVGEPKTLPLMLPSHLTKGLSPMQYQFYGPQSQNSMTMYDSSLQRFPFTEPWLGMAPAGQLVFGEERSKPVANQKSVGEERWNRRPPPPLGYYSTPAGYGSATPPGYSYDYAMPSPLPVTYYPIDPWRGDVFPDDGVFLSTSNPKAADAAKQTGSGSQPSYMMSPANGIAANDMNSRSPMAAPTNPANKNANSLMNSGKLDSTTTAAHPINAAARGSSANQNPIAGATHLINGDQDSSFAKGNAASMNYYSANPKFVESQYYGSSGDTQAYGNPGETQAYDSSGGTQTYGNPGEMRAYGNSGEMRGYDSSGGSQAYGYSGEMQAYGNPGEMRAHSSAHQSSTSMNPSPASPGYSTVESANPRVNSYEYSAMGYNPTTGSVYSARDDHPNPDYEGRQSGRYREPLRELVYSSDAILPLAEQMVVDALAIGAGQGPLPLRGLQNGGFQPFGYDRLYEGSGLVMPQRYHHQSYMRPIERIIVP